MIVLGNPILYKIFGLKVKLWMRKQCICSDLFLTLLVSKLGLSTNIRLTKQILRILISLPGEVLEANEYLRDYFIDQGTNRESVLKTLQRYDEALAKCFKPNL
jgi:hypothetical protein